MQQGATEATNENQLVVGVGRINGISGSDFDPPSLFSVGLQGRADGFSQEGEKRGDQPKKVEKSNLPSSPASLVPQVWFACTDGEGRGSMGVGKGPSFSELTGRLSLGEVEPTVHMGEEERL